MTVQAQHRTRLFSGAGYWLFGIALVAGSAALLVDLRLGLVAAAVVFGWTQIGGL